MSSTDTHTARDAETDEAETDEAAVDVTLDDVECELVTAELDAIIPALSGERRERYSELRDAAQDGVVPAELATVLGGVLELTLQTARARQLYRAEGERILTGLFRRTPRGSELNEQVRTVNAALRAVAGANLDSVRVRMRTVGHFSITIASDAAKITLGVRPDSVNVESVAVGEQRDA